MAPRQPKASTSAKTAPHPEGQVRRSQVLTTFGPGALVDFPKHAAIMGGLESWGDPDRDGFQQVFEERLEAALRRRERNTGLRLFSPPTSPDNPDDPPRGIAAFEFPEWFVEQPSEGQIGQDGFRSRRLLHRRAVERGKYGPVVPIRFVKACPNGHVGDIDWRSYAHGGATECSRDLFLDERGTSGDLADILVRCACRQSRSLVDATKPGDASPLGPCRGESPWLGTAGSPGEGKVPCLDEAGKPRRNKLLVRSATNAYFPQNISAISIPPDGEKQAVRQAVQEAWSDFESAEDLGMVAHELKKAKYKHLRERHNADVLWAEVQRRKAAPDEDTPRGIKAVELDTFLDTKASSGDETPEKQDFFAVSLPLDPNRSGPMKLVSRVVLVHRLREVVAQLGFTRFEPPVRDVDYELSLGVRTAPLTREVTWLPAVENRGEGIFLSLDPAALDRWRDRLEVDARCKQLVAGFESWKARRQVKNARFPGVTYVMLHSLSHLLLTAVSLECGYSASSIRERIYLDGERCGILLFTGTPDAEGTLGGLAEVGKKLGHHLEAALTLGRLCSNDPVCAQHHPDNVHEERFLHGAACHGCLLVSESSCEWSNELLDRALVIDTVADAGMAFFAEV